jgi:ATP-dependent helicase HepA
VLLEIQWQIAILPRLSHALKPYLNRNLLRTLTLEGGTTDLSTILTEDALAPQIKTLPVKMVRKMIHSAKERIPPIYEIGLGHAKEQFETALKNARQAHEAAAEAKIERTRYLAGVNPLVDEQDVMKAEMQAEMHGQAWDDVELQPVGVRMILCAPPGTV